jgi:hypothetical protein
VGNSRAVEAVIVDGSIQIDGRFDVVGKVPDEVVEVPIVLRPNEPGVRVLAWTAWLRRLSARLCVANVDERPPIVPLAHYGAARHR